ncbi:hypothetical protein THOM_1413 [Trachipleistophora hominis]|uniref:Uncharacterized protein n=1 Tax=Trachipleistophora hominis TaxID=72359 RepID=L7JY19_TRAHO|nr:hypothetical protein THOM_1413 [Trachipleistophora hominis]
MLKGMLNCMFSKLYITKMHGAVLILSMCTFKVMNKEVVDLLVKV